MPLESNCQQLATEVKITGIEWVDIPAGQACPRTHSGSSATVHCVIRLAGVLSRTAGRPDARTPGRRLPVFVRFLAPDTQGDAGFGFESEQGNFSAAALTDAISARFNTLERMIDFHEQILLAQNER